MAPKGVVGKKQSERALTEGCQMEDRTRRCFDVFPFVSRSDNEEDSDLYGLASDCFIHSHLQSSSYMSITCLFPIESLSET